jgi:hypothetical protein
VSLRNSGGKDNKRSFKRYLHKNLIPTRKGKTMKEGLEMRKNTIWAYRDGKKLVDVLEAALDNHMMTIDLKKKLIAENPDHVITFKVI